MGPRRSYDVIIVGAGSIGLPAALAMAEAGLRTLVVDQAASAGQGSNKAAIGGIRATHSDPAKIRICLRSIEIFSTWKERRGEDIEWHRGGYCFVAYAENEERALRELLVIQKAFGLKIDWLDKAAMLDLLPDLNPEGLLGGTYAPGDGNASPLLAAHAFFQAARRAGAEFRFREPVRDLILANGAVRGVRTDAGEYGAEVVVNAAGGWAAEIGRMAGLELPVKPDSHEAAVTEPVARFLEPLVVDIRPLGPSANYYFYQHKTGQVVFCITPSPSIWGLDTRETSSFLPLVARRLVSLMPRLRHIRVRRTWRGLYPMTPDGAPIVGWAREVKGFLQAAGMCGQGFMIGPGLGEMLAQMVTGRLSAEDRESLGLLSPYRSFEGQEKLK
ncbi:MAG: FAD-binding oxidoreductase [Candidatus Aminicenantes bacterium]|nr:FAD-binding oxidoreductase [Candidatus Aminicenantes bacterium]